MASGISCFTAIDFETAHPRRSSVCQIGLVRVENWRIIQKIEYLIKPPNNEYAPINMAIHGITPSRTLKSPTFNKIWPDIRGYIEGQNVVAHNAAFDCSCLQQTLNHYKLRVPSFNVHCTYKLYGARLDVLCTQFKIDFNHHNALSDALACAELFMMYHNKRSKI